jgi:hypothetical protein
MPARSKKQRQVAAIAEYHPEKLYKRNRGMLNMTHKQLHDYAATKEKNLPNHAAKSLLKIAKKRRREGR